MSQYPPPYQPPQPGYATPPGYPPMSPSVLGPARRAGILMFVLGGLSVLGGLCCGISGSMIEQIIAQQPAMAQDLPPEATPEVLRIGLLVVAAVSVVYGIGLVVLGLFVRKNSKAAIITSIVVAGLTLLYLAFTFIKAAVGGVQQGPEAVTGICMAFIPFGLYGLLLFWLIQAIRNVSAARAAGQYPPEYLAYLQQHYAYQQQVWQQQQQQQGGQVPPPPPPAAAPSPPPPPTPGPGDGGSNEPR